MPISLNPSIRPASIRSLGNIFVFCRKKKIKKAVVALGRITAAKVSIPKGGKIWEIAPNILYKGTIREAKGIIKDSNRILKTISLPLLL